MKIVYFSNFINHHQANVSEELYSLTGGNYTFVELCPIYDWLVKSGYPDFSGKPYVLQAWKSDDNLKKALRLLVEADVALFGGPETLQYEVIRAKTGKLTFDVSERWLKRGIINVLSPRLIKYFWKYYTVFAYKNVYKLCASAFACGDHYRLHSFKNKCFKWGYFTKVDANIQFKYSSEDSVAKKTSLMWCARFLDWKHPEMPVKLAQRLKAKGYPFVLDIFGTGEQLEQTRQLAIKLKVDDVVYFRGNLPNEQILQQMREHEVFLFTSDKNEGWGAVANEAMSNGCVIVGSDAIGSTPFLVKDGENGCLFKSCDLDSLAEKVEWLLNNPEKRRILSVNGYKTMRDVWSPKNAAINFLQLVEDIQQGRDCSIEDGPCSKALPIYN